MQFNRVFFQHICPKLFCPHQKCVNFCMWPFFAYAWETILLVFEHPPNKMECNFYQLFCNSWLNICFFTVGKSKLQIIIYQTMSPQTKSTTIVMHQKTLNLSCSCKLQKTLWLQSAAAIFFQHNLFCYSSDLYYYSLSKASSNSISWNKKTLRLFWSEDMTLVWGFSIR